MNKAAITHLQTDAFLFATASQTVCIRIKTAIGDVESVQLIHGDPYHWHGEAWQYQQTPMCNVGADETHDYWEATIFLTFSRLRYGFLLKSKGRTIVFTERGFAKKTPTEISSYFCLPYLHDNDRFLPPAWAKETIWYQIFPERFANGNPDLSPPNARPWGSEAPKADSFFGGDLKGVIDRLDYLTSLGISGIYFTPIFKAFSNHKYDTIDYMQLDPHFGDEATLKELVEQCHKRGIKVMLDAVFNHSGYYFPPFQDVLKKGAASRYKNWFHIHQFPIEGEAGKHYYETFAFVPSMPKLNTSNPEVKAYLLRCARYWLETFDIDGWRLDVANEVDHAFWREFRQVVKNTKQDAYILGEVWHQANPWLQGDQFDGVMNYPLTDAIFDFVQHGKSASTFQHAVTKHLYSYPKLVNEVQFNLLGSHDTPRILTACGGNKQLVKLSYLLLFSFPGSPCIYYGDEIGMAGENDPGCRACMVWEEDQQDRELLFQFLQKLIKIRKTHQAMGTYDTLQFYDSGTEDVLLYSTSAGGELLLFAVNRSKTEATIKLPNSLKSHAFVDVICESPLQSEELHIEGEHFLLLHSADDTKRG